MSPTEVSVNELLSNVAEGNAALARMHGTELTVASGPAVVARLDASLLRRALDNLVENALRHARRVSLSVSKQEHFVSLEVRDDGPGIPEGVRSAIFDRYAQVKSPSAQSSHNRGLGLTFVRLAARAHGGDATVDCPTAGGSVFRISVPTDRGRSRRPNPGDGDR